MTVAVLVVCPADIRSAAMEWGRAGLVADSFWLSYDDVLHIDPDHPNRITAQPIIPGEACDPAPLVTLLAELGSLTEVRVAWIRLPEEELGPSLRTLEGLLRELLPPGPAQQWLDIVMPTRRTDQTVIRLAGHWVQMRILAEDRSAPNITDAGWDLGLDVTLHAAMAVVGILGGKFHELPWGGGGSSAAEYYEVRAFSRLVLGALNTAAETDRFVSQTIPASSAGTFFPKRYLELDDEAAGSLVEDAVRYILELDSRALSYRDPPPSEFAPPPRLTLWEHLVVLARFVGYAVQVLLGIRPALKTVTLSRFNFDDLGHKVGKDLPAVDRSLRPTDYDELDALAADEARKKLDALGRELLRNPPMPAARGWRALIELAANLNDAGPAPDQWDPPLRFDRVPVVAPAFVQPATPSSVTSTTPELAAARSSAVAVLAANDCRRRRHAALAVLNDSSGAVKTAQTLASEGNALDQQRLNEQLGDVDAPTGREPIGFLDRLGGRLLGAGLRARLDAERWAEFATAPTASDGLDWRAAERKFRRRTLIGSGVAAGVGAVWGVLSYFLRGSLPAWLTMPVGFAAIALGFAVFLLWMFYGLFKVYSARLERGRRRLELRNIWLARASAALEEAARLAPARLIYGKWLDILGAIFPFDSSTAARPDRIMPAKAPKCMAVALPVYSDREMIDWLAEEGAEEGWRSRAVAQMAAKALGEDRAEAVKRLVADNGVKGGPLFDMWERRHELWQTYSESLRFTSTLGIAACMIESEDRTVSLISPKPDDDEPETLLTTFSAEPWPEGDDLDPWAYDFKVESRLGPGGGAVRQNPDTCLMAVRIQLRRTDQNVDVDTSESEPDQDVDDDTH